MTRAGRQRVWIAGVTWAALAAGTAMAADLGRPFMQPPTMGPAFSWTGLYIGTHTGVAVGSTRTTNVTPFGGFDSGIALNYEVNPVGIVGGGQVGYNWQAGAFVFGAEFDGGYLGARAQQRPAPDDFVETRYGWYGTATARVGLASERLLSYVKGGAVGAQLRHTASDLSPLGAVTPTDFSQSTGAKWGWTIGSGFEYAILPNWSIKSEYLYMDFGKMRTANLDGDFFDHRSHVHSLKIGLNYRWGGGPVTAAY